jgi:hypothetical protein
MALPAALAHGVVVSTGCIGNRVYTDLGDDELYVAIPGRDLAKVAEEAQAIAGANAKLSEYHRGDDRSWRPNSAHSFAAHVGWQILRDRLATVRRRGVSRTMIAPC